MDRFKTLKDDIPLLQDFVTNTSTPTTTSTIKENPFIPYEHLAQLAHERQQFKQELDTFTENMKYENQYKIAQSNAKNMKPLTVKESTINAITERILAQLKPVIKEQVDKELSLYLDECIDN